MSMNDANSKASTRDSSSSWDDEDDGIGLPEGFQPEKQRSLGISIMRTLIEGDLGGTIRYANREGGGTRVTIRIPKKES